MQPIKGFEKLGLSGRDSRVYTTLLAEGLASIRQIADRTGINRGSVYESIKALSGVGLVSHQQVNINKKYFAEEPTKILQLIKQRQDELNELEKTTKELIPTLAKSTAYLPYSNIKFYEGDEGVATILRDVLERTATLERKEYCVISAKPLRKYLYGKFPNFTTKRIAQKIHVRALAIGSGGDDAQYSERKWLDIASDSRPASYTLVYDNCYALIALNDNLNPYGIVIEDTGVADMQRMIFDQLWASARTK